MKTIKAILQEHLATNKADLLEHDSIKTALSSQDGKPFNKHLNKHLPEGYSIKIEYSLCHVVSPSGNNHLLGWMSNPFLDLSKLDNTNSAYCNGSKSRISQIEGFLNNPDKLKQLTSMFMKVKKAWTAFKVVANEIEASKMEAYFNPAYYDLLRNFEVPYRIISDIRFNKIDLS